MSATDDMLGIIPPIVVAGAATQMANTMFGKQKTKVVYKYKSKKKTKRKTRSTKSKSSVKKYL